MRKRTHICYLLIAVLVLSAVLSGCKEKEETAKGKTREIGSKPTGEVTGTPEPTADPTATPTATPTAAPKDVDIPEEYYGMWFEYSAEGLEASSDNIDDPYRDERMEIYEKGLSLTLSFNRINEAVDSDDFVLRTDFTEEEREFYRNMGYGMETYLDHLTDPENGHFIYSGTNEKHYGALFIVNLQPDGSLRTIYAYVDDNGTFPVMTESVYKREPLFPMGTYYEDYLGIWYCRTFAHYYEDAFEASDEDPIDYRIWVCNDGTAHIIDTWGDERQNFGIYNYTVCQYFSSEELSEYRRWDQDGILVWGEKEQGVAEEIAKQQTSLPDGRLIFVCNDYGYEGELLSLSFWPQQENGKDILCVDWVGYDSGQEYAMYMTFTRENPYSYAMGSYFSDFAGTWNETAFRREGDDMMTVYKDPLNYPQFIVYTEQNAVEMLPDGTEKDYRRRDDQRTTEPSWYDTYGISGTLTDFSIGRAVYVSSEMTDRNGTVMILEFQRDGSIVAEKYEMKNGTMTHYPQILLDREGGLER